MGLTGNILIAPPSVKTSFWHKTSVLVTEHSADGSMGLVLNKRSNLTIVDFAKQLGTDLDVPGYIYHGGPINLKSFTLLHTPEWSCSNTVRISENFSLSSAEDIIPMFALGNQPNNWRMFLGVCGWSPAQLVNEIKGNPPYVHENSWLLTSSNPNIVFDHDGNDQWCACLDQSASEFAQNLLD